MKKLLFLFLVFAFATVAQAQFVDQRLLDKIKAAFAPAVEKK